MGLTKAQHAIVEKAQSVGGGQQGVALDDDSCTYLVATIARDLGVSDEFPELPNTFPSFFSKLPPHQLRIESADFFSLFERLVALDNDADTYFSALAALLKGRLKYERILQTQPLPTLDQVGPRGLLQYGALSPMTLTFFLMWRKWIFDIDNRAAQETGYLFEPIIAHAIGGVPVSARRSPIRRRSDPSKGRQVDCVSRKRAYEFKLRVTIAASGQGRWKEELDFPGDCRDSGYTPVLIVLDPTPNPKLAELSSAFAKENGLAYVGKDAWAHLENEAGETMGKFLQSYVQVPIESLLITETSDLPPLTLTLTEKLFRAEIRGESLQVKRLVPADSADSEPRMPDDIDDDSPGA